MRNTKYEIKCGNVGLHVKRDTVVHVKMWED